MTKLCKVKPTAIETFQMLNNCRQKDMKLNHAIKQQGLHTINKCNSLFFQLNNFKIICVKGLQKLKHLGYIYGHEKHVKTAMQYIVNEQS